MRLTMMIMTTTTRQSLSHGPKRCQSRCSRPPAASHSGPAAPEARTTGNLNHPCRRQQPEDRARAFHSKANLPLAAAAAPGLCFIDSNPCKFTMVDNRIWCKLPSQTRTRSASDGRQDSTRYSDLNVVPAHWSRQAVTVALSHRQPGQSRWQLNFKSSHVRRGRRPGQLA